MNTVTVELPQPLKTVKDNQIVWFWEYNHNYGTEPDLVDEPLYVLRKHNFSNSNYFHSLLELGQLFKTRKDAELFLKVLRSIRK